MEPEDVVPEGRKAGICERALLSLAFLCLLFARQDSEVGALVIEDPKAAVAFCRASIACQPADPRPAASGDTLQMTGEGVYQRQILDRFDEEWARHRTRSFLLARSGA